MTTDRLSNKKWTWLIGNMLSKPDLIIPDVPIGIQVSGPIGSGKSTISNFIIEILSSSRRSPFFIRNLAYGNILKECCAIIFQFDESYAFTQEGKLKSIMMPSIQDILKEGSIEKSIRKLYLLDDDMKLDDGFILESGLTYFKAFTIFRNVIEWISAKVLLTVGEILQFFGTNMRHPETGLGEDVWVKHIVRNFNNVTGESLPIYLISDCRFPNEADSLRDITPYSYVLRVSGDPMKINMNTTRDKNHPSETALNNYKGFYATIKNQDISLDELRERIAFVLHSILSEVLLGLPHLSIPEI